MMKQFKIQKPKVKSFAVKIFLLFTFYFLFDNASAQSVSASLDRDKILLGEQVVLQFNLNNVNRGTTFIESWPQVNDTVNHAEIVKRHDIDTIILNGLDTYQQNFTITSFDSGRWQLGPFVFIIQDKTSGKKLQLETAPVYLTVLPVDVSAMKDYHPIKDIIDVETSFNWIPVIIALIIALLAVAIYIIIKKRKKKVAGAPKIILMGTPLERAMEKLRVLEKEFLISTESTKRFHSDIDITTRQYFEEMMNVKALQLTAGELFSRLTMYMQDVQLRNRFRHVFELNASVKFAKYMPAEDESKSTLKEVIKSIHEIDTIINKARANADRMVSKY